MEKKILNIELLEGDEVIIKSNYVYLEPYAQDVMRKFVFKEITYDKREKLKYDTDININVLTKSQDIELIQTIDLWMFDWSEDNKTELWVEGFIKDYPIVNQATLDTLYDWQSDVKSDWFNYTTFRKRGYLDACRVWAGLSHELIKKDEYYVNWSLINDVQDLIYLTSIDFFCERGYLGVDIRGYEYFIHTLYREDSLFKDIKLIFLNRDKITDPEILKLYEEVKEYFNRFKIAVIEQNEF